jgi:hypothetical protein
MRRAVAGPAVDPAAAAVRRLAFGSGDGATLAIVIVNDSATAARSYTFDVTALAGVGAQTAVYRTSRTENLASLAAIPVQDWSFTVAAPAYSITTLVVPLR